MRNPPSLQFRSFSLSQPSRIVGVLCSAIAGIASASEEVSFNRDIRPILSDKCFHCHGPDEKDRKAGLRLDSLQAALKGGDSGPAFDPAKPESSELLLRVLSKDKDEMMPPPKMHKAVTPAEAEVLRRWIADGAPYQGHWAFIKPERPTPPSNASNPIDAFILKKLAEQGLKPSPEAAKETLIRRATLDLTGLPPTMEEIAAFTQDNAPGAYERVVDRVLASPSYGEHMAARWLDMARYADSNGFQSDTKREMWPWRDWVIRALNENKPFDQFTIEQLAGDLLPKATRDQIVATGFNRNHRLNGEGGRIVEEWFGETVIDRVETTGMTWLALTLNCCRCHDHKYDPISQKEFYQLFAYFNSNEESGVLDDINAAAGSMHRGNTKPFLLLPTPEQEQTQAKLDASVKAAEAQLAAASEAGSGLQTAWEKNLLRQIDSPQPAWKILAATEARSTRGATLTRQADESWLVSGVNPDNDTYEISAKLAPEDITGLMIEVLPDPSLSQQRFGRGANGNFALTGVELEVETPGGIQPSVARFTRAEADYEQKGWEIAQLIDGQPGPGKGKRAAKAPKKEKGWAVDSASKPAGTPRKALFVGEPLTVPENAVVTIRLVHGSQQGDSNIGRFRLSTTALPPSTVTFDGARVPEAVKDTLHLEPAERSPAQATELAKYFRDSAEHPARKAEAALAAAKKAVEDFRKAVPSTMVFHEMAQPRPAYVFNRGEYDKPGARVERAVPAVLPPLPAGASNDRLGFAQWLVSGEHPLTARVWVNRAWEQFFGTGLVKTSENFGSQAEWPTHPELLDWLATEFVRVKWDMKAMHRLMVTSATYRQSSQVTPELLAKDPDNRLLARAPRLRLSGEELRDQALAVGGLLVGKIGGPSVKPYMPASVWDETSVYGDMRNYKPDTGEGLYRRTLYTIWKRTAAPPSMLLFDSPSREICTVKRSRSNTPTQALSLLNEVTYLEAARRLAERMLTEGGNTPEERIAWGFALVTGRKPDAFELQRLTSSVRARLAGYAQDMEAAKQLIIQGASKPNPRINPVDLAAYAVTANVLLNLDEVVTRN